MKPLRQFLCMLCFCCLQWTSSLVFASPESIILWHSLAGSLGEELNQVIAGFNASQEHYRIKPIYKGEYTEALTSFAAAFRAHQPPDIIQVFEVGTATMLSPPGIIKPLYALLQESGISLAEDESIMPAIQAFYSRGGRIMAMPFNTSVPLVFYNADLLRRFGIKSPVDFPKTWDALQHLAAKMKGLGQNCVYTTAYPAWIHIEAFAAIHGLSLFHNKNDKPNQACFNNDAIIHHLNRLKDWQKKHYFEYGGRSNDATVLFTSGRCALFSQSSGAYKGLAALVPFHLGVAPLPLDESISSYRHNNVIGGGALWAVTKEAGQQHYRGIAEFYKYLAKEPVQQRWYQNTGYLPLGQASPGKSTPTLDIARFDLGRKENSPFLCAIPQNQIRSINDEALEAIFSNTKEARFAMNEAVVRANFAVERFSRNTESRNRKH